MGQIIHKTLLELSFWAFCNILHIYIYYGSVRPSLLIESTDSMKGQPDDERGYG